MTKTIFLLCLCLCLGLPLTLSAQPEPVSTSLAQNPPPADVNTPPFNADELPTRTSQEIWLSLGVLLFGLAVVIGQIYLLQRREESLSESMKYLSVTLIIVGSLFLVTAGYGNTQIAPIIGLLGTVAGYLLGRQRDHPK